MKLPSVERVVALATPVFAASSAWATGAVAKYGIHLDKTGVTASLVAGATVGLGAAVKWLDGRSKFVNLTKQIEADADKAMPVIKEIAPDLADQIKQLITEGINAAAGAILPTDAEEAAAPPPAAVPVAVISDGSNTGTGNAASTLPAAESGPVAQAPGA